MTLRISLEELAQRESEQTEWKENVAAHPRSLTAKLTPTRTRAPAKSTMPRRKTAKKSVKRKLAKKKSQRG